MLVWFCISHIRCCSFPDYTFFCTILLLVFFSSSSSSSSSSHSVEFKVKNVCCCCCCVCERVFSPLQRYYCCWFFFALAYVLFLGQCVYCFIGKNNNNKISSSHNRIAATTQTSKEEKKKLWQIGLSSMLNYAIVHWTYINHTQHTHKKNTHSLTERAKYLKTSRVSLNEIYIDNCFSIALQGIWLKWADFSLCRSTEGVISTLNDDNWLKRQKKTRERHIERERRAYAIEWD